MNIGDELRSKGWTQGSVLSLSDGLSGNETFASEPTDCVVISHPCDVVASTLESEPTVEVIPRRVVQSLNGNFCHGKNPRVLHYADSGTNFELRMCDRTSMPREALALLEPSGAVTRIALTTLRRWLSNRYARAAFADSFNERSAVAGRTIAKTLKRDGRHISAIYLLVTDAELGVDDIYEVSLIATMTVEDYEDGALRTGATEVIDKVALVLGESPGVSVLDHELRSEEELSVADLRVLKRWDYDHMSLRDEGSRSPLDDV